MTKNLVEIKIKDLAFDGKAVGEMDGKIVFLKGGLPGETVKAEIVQEKRRYNYGIVREIIVKSDKRIKAKCIHFGECGGCTWQDLKYEDQLIYKQKQVNDCIERLAKLDDVKINNIIGSKEIFNYRNKMEYSYNTGDDNTFTLGLHRRGAFDQIFDLTECYISGEIDSEIVKWVRNFVKTENIPVYDVFTHVGYMRFLMIRQTKNTNQLMINIVTNYGDFEQSDKFIKDITKAFPQITTIIHNQNGQKSNIATGEIEKTLYGPGYIEEKLFDMTFKISANSFFQTNSKQAEVLYQTGFDMLKPQKSDSILDLYCGTGTIGIIISKYVNDVTGVELVSDAVKAAKENAQTNKVSNVTFFESDVKSFLIEKNKSEENYDSVIIDPPRAGLNPKVLKHLLKLNPDKILYISCNPATYARDARELVNKGYSLPEITPVDMFPHTQHIELVSVFYRQ